MMKRSAGILPYKYIDGNLYVFLAHPGGPYWEGINLWSICKGEYVFEKAIDAAQREFFEETNVMLNKEDLFYLGTIKQKSTNKLVVIFCCEIDIDNNEIKSNTFCMEWPKGSGKIVEFPEMDKAKWFKLDEASNIIFLGQKKFLNKLSDLVKR